jgi:hypothetical protein
LIAEKRGSTRPRLGGCRVSGQKEVNLTTFVLTAGLVGLVCLSICLSSFHLPCPSLTSIFFICRSAFLTCGVQPIQYSTTYQWQHPSNQHHVPERRKPSSYSSLELSVLNPRYRPKTCSLSLSSTAAAHISHHTSIDPYSPHF